MRSETSSTTYKCVRVKSYLGLISYYRKFMPNLATVLAPLHELLRKNTKWKWGPDQERAFVESKNLLMSQHVFVHYDPELRKIQISSLLGMVLNSLTFDL